MMVRGWEKFVFSDGADPMAKGLAAEGETDRVNEWSTEFIPLGEA